MNHGARYTMEFMIKSMEIPSSDIRSLIYIYIYIYIQVEMDPISSSTFCVWTAHKHHKYQLKHTCDLRRFFKSIIDIKFAILTVCNSYNWGVQSLSITFVNIQNKVLGMYILTWFLWHCMITFPYRICEIMAGIIVHGPTVVPMHPPPPPHDPPWVESNCSVDPQEWFKRCCHFLNWSMHQWRSFY